MHCSCNDEDSGGRKSNLIVAGSAFMGADYRVRHFYFLDTGQFGDIIVNCLSPLKSIFYKKILELAVHPKKLQMTAPYFGACWSEIWGQSFANFLDELLFQVFL